MSLERLRNVKSGEIRDVETNSDEYQDLINEVYDHDGSARPKWEITGQHHARRVDEGDVQEEDFGYQHKPVGVAEIDISTVGPELHPERALTDAELEMGVESYEQKMKDLNLTHSTTPLGVRDDVEPLGRTDPKKRAEEGRKQAGSTSKSRSGKSGGSGSKSSGSGGSGGSASSGGSSGSGSSGSGSSGSSGGGSSSGSTSGSSSGSGGSGSGGSGS